MVDTHKGLTIGSSVASYTTAAIISSVCYSSVVFFETKKTLASTSSKSPFSSLHYNCGKSSLILNLSLKQFSSLQVSNEEWRASLPRASVAAAAAHH